MERRIVAQIGAMIAVRVRARAFNGQRRALRTGETILESGEVDEIHVPVLIKITKRRASAQFAAKIHRGHDARIVPVIVAAE